MGATTLILLSAVKFRSIGVLLTAWPAEGFWKNFPLNLIDISSAVRFYMLLELRFARFAVLCSFMAFDWGPLASVTLACWSRAKRSCWSFISMKCSWLRPSSCSICLAFKMAELSIGRLSDCELLTSCLLRFTAVVRLSPLGSCFGA